MDEVVCRAENLHLRQWDGEYVIYNEKNDRTHLVTGFAARAFSELAGDSRERSAIINELMSAGAAKEEAEGAIAYLRELELIETRRSV